VEITRELFVEQRSRRFGNANPERMQIAFWEWMVREGEGPHRVRELFSVPFKREDGPIWTFSRMGATRTRLSDGRTVSVGGEYDDSYDPDFCIYNDVIVQGPADQVEIYGYPSDCFPATDFHTATLIDERIVIVGCLGYQQSRRSGHTPVYLLDLGNYHIEEVRTVGESPGWIFKHDAELGSNGVINIRGGEVIQTKGEKQRYRRSLDDYTLDTRSWTWVRTTKRNWRQFSIAQEDGGLFVLDKHPKPEALLPRDIGYVRTSCEEWNGIRIIVAGVPISITVGVSFIDLIIEGDLPAETSQALAEEIRRLAESATASHCIFD